MAEREDTEYQSTTEIAHVSSRYQCSSHLDIVYRDVHTAMTRINDDVNHLVCEFWSLKETIMQSTKSMEREVSEIKIKIEHALTVHEEVEGLGSVVKKLEAKVNELSNLHKSLINLSNMVSTEANEQREIAERIQHLEKHTARSPPKGTISDSPHDRRSWMLSVTEVIEKLKDEMKKIKDAIPSLRAEKSEKPKDRLFLEDLQEFLEKQIQDISKYRCRSSSHDSGVGSLKHSISKTPSNETFDPSLGNAVVFNTQQSVLSDGSFENGVGLESPLSTVTDVVLSPNEKHSESLCDIMEERDELQDTSLPLHTPSRDSITHSSPLYSDVQHIYDPRLDIVLTSLLQLVKSHLNQN